MKGSIQEIISHRIKKLRIEKSLTQRTLAKAAGIDHTYLAKIESGKRIPLLKTICALADVLNVNTHELLIPLEEKRQGKLSQKQTELIKIVQESSPAEISLYFRLMNALDKKKKN